MRLFVSFPTSLKVTIHASINNSGKCKIKIYTCLLNNNTTLAINAIDVRVLDEMGLSRIRTSPDTVVNGYGRKLIELCKNKNVYIKVHLEMIK